MKLLYALVLAVFVGTTAAADLTYEGTWVTTNRQLDGTMTCVATDLGNNKWKGRFYGIWQGRRFDYTIEWSGPPDKLAGKATIDGAKYDWKGEMGAQSPGWFKGSFTGNRYIGSFDLKEKKK